MVDLIIYICLLLLVSYFFDLISNYIKIPSVFFLIIIGFLLRFFFESLSFQVLNLEKSIIILGSLGLILIVQEAALELEFKKEKIPLILKAFFSAFFQLILQVSLFSLFFYIFLKYDLKPSILNSIPLSVISSAIAISSVKNFKNFDKEFIIYESAFSDILGIILFDFVYFNNNFNLGIIDDAFKNIFAIFLLSFISIILLIHLLNRIKHPVKFIPILLIVVSFYFLAKLYHLPALLFILFFGLALSNLHKIKDFRIGKKIDIESLNLEIDKYRSITFELTFLIRSIFFILFGFYFKISEIFNLKNFFIAIFILSLIYSIRFFILLFLGIKREKILFMAPRGLITIILFFLIDEKYKIFLIDKTLILQIIIISILLMLIETFKKEKEKNS